MNNRNITKGQDNLIRTLDITIKFGVREFFRKGGFVKKVIGLVIIVGVISLLSAFYIPGFTDKNQSRNAVEGVLDNVIEQNYDEAFKSVYIYDRASDLEPTISFNDAKTKWINRVKDLKEKGTYVVGYSNLRVKLDDTYPVGTVDLVIIENGEKTVKKNVDLWFAKREGNWKLGNLYINADAEEILGVLSGNFNSHEN
ncbi:hypothetical protein [Paenisporosarcina sp. TG-14]|uniref:hypothetical protein n=1 Tax=Paenisporosarcina sp. TG-14 TaxID=1231057 RepID=UPI00031060A4|nr:hypothetical protein [Paenisporosarcina sp. TG-14]